MKNLGRYKEEMGVDVRVPTMSSANRGVKLTGMAEKGETGVGGVERAKRALLMAHLRKFDEELSALGNA